MATVLGHIPDMVAYIYFMKEKRKTSMKVTHNQKDKIEAGKVTDFVKNALKKIDSFFNKMQAFQDADGSKPKPQKFKVYPASETEGEYILLTLTPRGNDGEYVDVEITTKDNTNPFTKKAVEFDMPDMDQIMKLCVSYMEKEYDEDGISDIEPINESIKLKLNKVMANGKPSLTLQSIYSTQAYNDTMNAITDILVDDTFINEMPEGDIVYEIVEDECGYECNQCNDENLLLQQVKITLELIMYHKARIDTNYIYLKDNNVSLAYTVLTQTLEDCRTYLLEMCRGEGINELLLEFPSIAITEMTSLHFKGTLCAIAEEIIDSLKLIECSLNDKYTVQPFIDELSTVSHL